MPVGVKGFPVPIELVNAASEYQVTVPPDPGKVIGVNAAPAQYGAGLVTTGV